MLRPLALLTVSAALALGVSACGSDEDSSSDTIPAAAAPTTTTTAPAATTPPAATGAAPASGGDCQKLESPSGTSKDVPCPTKTTVAGKANTVTMQTSEGAFTITLDTKRAPITANSFAYLAKRGFFDGTVFHRVVPGFVIQGGDPYATGTGANGGQGGPGYQITEAPPSDLQYTRGVVAMAKTSSDPSGASGSQFYVVSGQDAQLPPEYALVGKVTKGIASVLKIDALGKGDGPPSKKVEIAKATFAAG